MRWPCAAANPSYDTDGDIGRVQGLVIDSRNHDVTHVLLQEGHLRGRKDVAIQVSAVASTSDGIRLKIAKQKVQDLPPVDVDHKDALEAEAQTGAPAGNNKIED